MAVRVGNDLDVECRGEAMMSLQDVRGCHRGFKREKRKAQLLGRVRRARIQSVVVVAQAWDLSVQTEHVEDWINLPIAATFLVLLINLTAITAALQSLL